MNATRADSGGVSECAVRSDAGANCTVLSPAGVSVVDAATGAAVGVVKVPAERAPAAVAGQLWQFQTAQGGTYMLTMK